MKNHWLAKHEYPFKSNFFQINGQQMHFVDEGKGDVLLFVHGTPSWSFDFRNQLKMLSKTYRCIAIDHVGFGLSDKPKNYDYSTQNHSATLQKFIIENNLTNITLIVHDFGGPIGLNVAIQMPERFKQFVILNSWLWSSENEPEFIKLKKILKSPLLPFLYLNLNFSPRFILPKSFGEKKLASHLKSQFTKPFSKKSERYGALAFAKSLLNDQTWFEEMWQSKNKISYKPTLFIWGMKDPVIKPHHLNKFLTGFTNHQVIKLDSCGHFPQEEETVAVSNAILQFLLTT